MSIYLVKLCEFHNDPNDEYFENAYSMVTYLRCYACGGKCRWKAAVAWHSFAWGNGDLFCSWKCAKSRKEYQLDKRQKRTYNRRYGKLGKGFNLYTLNAK